MKPLHAPLFTAGPNSQLPTGTADATVAIVQKVKCLFYLHSVSLAFLIIGRLPIALACVYTGQQLEQQQSFDGRFGQFF